MSSFPQVIPVWNQEEAASSPESEAEAAREREQGERDPGRPTQHQLITLPTFIQHRKSEGYRFGQVREELDARVGTSKGVLNYANEL